MKERPCQPALSFDTTVYYQVVAANLFTNLGEKALPYSESALAKMRVVRDTEGFEIWQGIYNALLELVGHTGREPRAVYH